MYKSIPNELRNMEASARRMEPYKRGLLHRAATAIEELNKRIDRAVELYNRGAEKSAMWEALEGLSPEPLPEERK